MQLSKKYSVTQKKIIFIIWKNFIYCIFINVRFTLFIHHYVLEGDGGLETLV